MLALWLIAWLNYQRFADWSQTFIATALSATLPWFFVSTGWLTYFDSWLVMGLLAVSFVPSRLALGAACLLTPWIDERFVFALPVVGLVRLVLLSATDPTWRQARLDAVIIAAATLPYPALRAIAWWQGESLSPTYVMYHWEHIASVPWSRFVGGLWSGFRAGWVMIGIALWLVPRRVGRAIGVLFGVVAVATLLAGLTIAADMSRTMVVGVPLLMLGTWLWNAADPERSRRVLPLILAANLLLPAEHVLWVAKVPIRYLYAQLDEYKNPPTQFQPGYYVAVGNSARQRLDREGARTAFQVAIRLDPEFAPAYAARAALSIDERDGAGARSDLTKALELGPDNPEALFLRAVLAQADGAEAAAAADLRRALAAAPLDWARRDEATRRLEGAEGRTSPLTR